MKRYRAYPLVCCDRECALVNDCRQGGRQCESCGGWFCPSMEGRGIDGNDYCDDCAERREREEQEEQEGNNE